MIHWGTAPGKATCDLEVTGAMRLAFFLAGLIGASLHGWAQTADAWTLETKGQAAEAQALLERAANATPANPAAIRAYAEFLDRYHDPAARRAYARLAQALDSSRAPAAERAAVLPSPGESRSSCGRSRCCRARSGCVHRRRRFRPAPLRRVWRSVPIQPSSRFPGPLAAFARMAALAPDLDAGRSAARARP